MGRPIEYQPDESLLWDLAFLGFDDRHIAEVIGCHQSLISRRPDIVRVLTQARDEEAVLRVVRWRGSSQGALRPEDRSSGLVAIVRQAHERKIRRKFIEVGDADLAAADRCLTATEQHNGKDRETIRARPERQPQGAAKD